MPSVVATVKLKEDQIEKGKAFFRKLAAETLENESGTLAYVVHERADDPRTIVVYEKYESNEAFALHGQNLGPKAAEFGAVMDGGPEIIMLEEL